MPLDPKDFETIVKGMTPVIREYVESQIAPLQRRIADLETRPNLKYCGTWEQKPYFAGSVVSFDGSAWVARELTTDKPGNGQTAWQLAVKRGRDGKDARS